MAAVIVAVIVCIVLAIMASHLLGLRAHEHALTETSGWAALIAALIAFLTHDGHNGLVIKLMSSIAAILGLVVLAAG
jgi:hypothetical protein